ncbi:cerebellin 18 [Embiotoca jacksoni]|uniref:cerebellin 18 n=1 Tax=Embiotoca jacksoni TaxID=100190 RepID=UPI003704CF05
MVVIPVLLLLGSLFLCGGVEAQTETQTIGEMLKQAALQWKGPVTCDKWDCNCTFKRQRGCCCATNEMHEMEEDTFIKVKYLWHEISRLNDRVKAVTDATKVAFTARMNTNIATTISGSAQPCFGPFNTNVPMPFSNVTLNNGNGYNAALGAFTAPCSGVYVLSFTVYSSVEKGGRLYHKVQLMMNGKLVVSVWENNREDGEDSATQVVTLKMQRGDQVYLELMSGRKLCTSPQNNIFTGYMLYPGTYE